MGEHMAKRGPDGAWYWISPDLGFAHRLAIMDLPEFGVQPVVPGDDRLIIVRNVLNSRHA